MKIKMQKVNDERYPVLYINKKYIGTAKKILEMKEQHDLLQGKKSLI